MTQASNLAKGGTNFNSTGNLSLTTGVTGTLPVANGGTGTTSTTFVNLTTNVTGTLPVANGGTGSTTAATVAGTGISVSGTFPNQTVTNSGVTSIVAGTGISISGGTGSVTVNSTASSAGITQVVSTTKTDTFTMASTTFTDITGLSVTITPSSSSSKILVIANVTHVGTTLTSASGIRLMRAGSPISVGASSGSRISVSGGESYGNYGVTLTGDAIMYLDSPATTAATTYNIQIRVYGSTAYVNRSAVDSDDQAYYRGVSSITVMEVKP